MTFSILKCNKIGSADAITSCTAKDITNNRFRSKQTRNKVPPNTIKGFQLRNMVRLIIWRPNERTAGKCYVVYVYKKRNKVCLVYLECKMQEDRHG